MKRILFLLAGVIIACATPARSVADEPNPGKVLSEAGALAKQGKYEEALQKHIWYHENALRLDPAQYGVRLSFALADWKELADKYPKAKQALIDIRDRDTKSLREGRGKLQQFHDVASINERLKEDRATAELFKTLHEKQPNLVKECYPIAEATLVAQREYSLCLSYIPDPFAKFDEARRYREETIKDRPNFAPAQWHAEKEFVRRTSRLVEILAGAGRRKDAEEIRRRALAVRDDDNIRQWLDAAMKSAEKPRQK